jgi:isopenicillin-N N-acyltransferase-like protein
MRTLQLLSIAASAYVSSAAFCSGKVSCSAGHVVALLELWIEMLLHRALTAPKLPSIASFCVQPNPNAQPNAYPINVTTPQFVRQVTNGKLYTAGGPGFEFYVAHIYGSPYELGYAHGQLFQGIAANVSNDVWAYFESQITSDLTFLPAWLSDMIANFGLEVALDVIADLTAPSTPAHFYQELQGLADATGVDYKRLLRIHLIGELTQGDCSMYGAWGNATADGKTLSMRALDWDTDIPAVQYPTVFVYHPNDGSNSFANVGFVGWIGALTGQSSQQMSIHEIGVAFPDATFGNESFRWYPLHFPAARYLTVRSVVQ